MLIDLKHGDAHAVFDMEAGNIPVWTIGGRSPLHVAPWRDEPEVQDDPNVADVDKRLAGDFFCMPFGRDDVHGHPIHGPTANAPWLMLNAEGSKGVFANTLPKMGDAVVAKEIRLVGESLLQRHIIDKGRGDVTFAHHPMVRMEEGGRLSFSRKRAAMTDPVAQHAGHNLWALNQVRGDLNLDCEDGGQWDLRTYPAGHVVEDFCTLVESRDNTLGWTCVMRNAEADMLLVLKDPAMMPVTMLWISNGARDFPPWNSRHTGVLGIEDGRALGGQGLAAAARDNRLSAMDVPTVLPLGEVHVIRHAMVSLPRPPGWSELSAVVLSRGTLTLREASGAEIAVPFPEGHFD
ncbi:hypothetical protein [Hasllibacter sp. MH4015]|uniref:hypothetical protein n=1 Tax=Hasllibacter sp. MH4015 TaxID=2854029 RepID=UPI001CD63F22|nr:hypothetical protein [Hasllibacter sp. MH4015]